MPRVGYHRWYGLGRWKKRAHAQLAAQPLCAFCLRTNKITPATIVDHVVPHRGNEYAFWNGEVQSLCAYHHNSHKKQDEFLGYSKDIGLDGWPVDKQHPVYRNK